MSDDGPNIVDFVLGHAKAVEEIRRALMVSSGNPQLAIVNTDLAIRLATLNKAAELNALLVAIHDALTERPAATPGQGYQEFSAADRAMDLAMGPAPDMLVQMLAATENRLSLEQRENERLRTRLAVYEPPPPVGTIPAPTEGEP